jgi:hypothetical protein
MPQAYSLDLRERVVAGGEGCRKAVRSYRVSVARVVKRSQRFGAMGIAAAKRIGDAAAFAGQGA